MKRLKAMLMFICVAVCLVFVTNAKGATINAASCSQANVQSAINAAANGDTVAIPAGSCSWSSSVSWTNKDITVQGAGIGNTVITGSGLFSINQTKTPASWRITGMTMTGGAPDRVIALHGENASIAMKGWRIDHIRFNYSQAQVNPLIMITGVLWGLIDNCTFDGTGYEISAIFGYLNSEGSGTPSGTLYWNRPVNLGTDEAVYFEDITVNFSGNGPTVFDLVYGGSAVLRHSTIKYNYFITHSARGNDRGGMKYEVYNNTFQGNGFYRVAQLRSGTGVIFNNTISGYSNNNFDVDNQRSSTESGCYAVSSPLGRCNGSSSYDGNVASNGWPCLDQTGRGGGAPKNQPSVPLYTWNNGTNATCATGGTCDNKSKVTINGACPSSAAWIKTTGDASPHPGGVVDYVNNGSTPKPGYTPYTYPHPLRSQTPPPQPMIDFRLKQ
jgi:hypothetical protein